jgi:hypothetical protein
MHLKWSKRSKEARYVFCHYYNMDASAVGSSWFGLERYSKIIQQMLEISLKF